MRRLVLAVAGAAALGGGLWLGARPAAAVAPSAEAGAELAARWCAACHVIAPDGAGTDAAPSFVSIARKRSPEEVKAFLAKSHAKSMRGFTLSTREIEDVTAYITSLNDKAGK